VLYAILAEATWLFVFRTQDALFTLFVSATFLPAFIYWRRSYSSLSTADAPSERRNSPGPVLNARHLNRASPC